MAVLCCAVVGTGTGPALGAGLLQHMRPHQHIVLTVAAASLVLCRHPVQLAGMLGGVAGAQYCTRGRGSRNCVFMPMQSRTFMMRV